MYSLVQWNWFSDVTGCTWVTCIQWRQRTNFTAPGCTGTLKEGVPWGKTMLICAVNTDKGASRVTNRPLINGGRAHYVTVSKVQWQPFCPATQLWPQNDWQFPVYYGVCAQTPFSWLSVLWLDVQTKISQCSGTCDLAQSVILQDPMNTFGFLSKLFSLGGMIAGCLLRNIDQKTAQTKTDFSLHSQ